MEFEAKTSMILKHILYTLLCETFFRGPQKVSRRETETWRPFCHLNQFTGQHVSLHTYANNLKIALENLPHVSYRLNIG